MARELSRPAVSGYVRSGKYRALPDPILAIMKEAIMAHHAGGHVRELMTKDPVCLSSDDPVIDAARQMRDQDIGPVIVLENDSICGIVTDRDITLRVVAEGKDANATKLGEICSKNPTTISPDDGVEDAVRLMKEHAVRRLPVVEGGKPIGIVALGDLSTMTNVDPAVEGISEAPPNN